MKGWTFLTLIVSAWGSFPRKPMENQNLYHGDMIVMDEMERNAVPNNTEIWPDGIVPYQIVGLDSLKGKILNAMKHIMGNTCIKFRPWDGVEKAYVRIFAGEDCYSFWGRTGSVQPLSLGVGCEPFGTIVHELMHTIGFDHEQNRSDRDDYLVIYWQNIWPSALNQFDKLKPEENRLFNKFDYDSIMLYGEKTFSKDGYSRTMKSRNKSIKLVDVVKKGNLSKRGISARARAFESISCTSAIRRLKYFE